MLIMIGIRLCQNHMTGSMSHPISAGVTDRQPRDRPGTHTTLYICWLIVELASPKGTRRLCFLFTSCLHFAKRCQMNSQYLPPPASAKSRQRSKKHFPPVQSKRGTLTICLSVQCCFSVYDVGRALISVSYDWGLT